MCPAPWSRTTQTIAFVHGLFTDCEKGSFIHHHFDFQRTAQESDGSCWKIDYKENEKVDDLRPTPRVTLLSPLSPPPRMTPSDEFRLEFFSLLLLVVEVRLKSAQA